MSRPPRRPDPWLPWTDGCGLPWPGRRFPLRAPFCLGYIAVAWALFVPTAEYRNGNWWTDFDAVRHLVFHIPHLTERPFLAIGTLVTGTWLNHDAIQLGYVTLLLLLFGVVFEVREGSFRAAGVFFATSFVAALVAGALLHAIYPHIWDTTLLESSWNRWWSGGSAGCFGLMGAVAARARRPAILLAMFLLWEAFIWWVNLRSWVSVFHLSALSAGFIAVRFGLPSHASQGRKRARSDQHVETGAQGR